MKRGIVLLAVAVVAAAGGGTLSGFAARHSWRLELASHFRLQYFWALVAATVVLALLRFKKLALLAAGLATVNLVLIVPLYLGPAPHADEGPRLKAMLFNVHYVNHDYGPTLELILNEMPDVVLLLEVTPEWIEALKFIKPEYPYEHLMPTVWGTGIALYSRHKITDLSVHESPQNDLPTIVATLDVPGGQLTLLGTHPGSPRTANDFKLRNLQLQQVAKLASERAGPVMLLGDLNTTSWSPYFEDLLTTSGLRDSRRGFGVEGSWPWWPTPLLRIPIDHCLVSEAVSVLDRRIGPAAGWNL